MINDSKFFTKNIMCIVIIVIIILFIIYLIHILFKKNKKYESFMTTTHYTSHYTSSNTSSNTIPYANIPHGSYTKSCSNLQYLNGNKNIMRATCRHSKNNKDITSTIILPCTKSNGISNCDGELKCGPC